MNNGKFRELPFYRDVPLKVTFLHLLLFSNEQSEYVCSFSTLAKECGLTDNEVRRAIRILSSSGYISTENIGYRNIKFKVLASHWQAVGEPLASGTKCDTADYNSQPQAIGEPLVSGLQANADNKEDLLDEKRQNRFIPPTIEQVQQYIDEKHYHFSADDFITHYQTTGWMIGKKKVKSWKGCCSTFEKTWKAQNEVLIANNRLLEQYPNGTSPYANFLHFIVNSTTNIIKSVPLPGEQEMAMINASYRPFFVDAIKLMDGDEWLRKTTFWGAFIKAINNTKKALTNDDISKRQQSVRELNIKEAIRRRSEEYDSVGDELPY